MDVASWTNGPPSQERAIGCDTAVVKPWDLLAAQQARDRLAHSETARHAKAAEARRPSQSTDVGIGPKQWCSVGGKRAEP